MLCPWRYDTNCKQLNQAYDPDFLTYGLRKALFFQMSKGCDIDCAAKAASGIDNGIEELNRIMRQVFA